MLNLNFVTTKRHFLARNRVIQAIVHVLKSLQSFFSVEDGKKKREVKPGN